MTNYESKALEVLLAHEKTKDPFGGPVQAVGMALGLPTAEARTFVADMVRNGLVRIRMEASNFAEVGQVVVSPTWWEKGPQAE
jgi:DNA-binding IclR family transcriptional regulator